jgi:adenylyltransferase/sulfurtransferase
MAKRKKRTSERTMISSSTDEITADRINELEKRIRELEAENIELRRQQQQSSSASSSSSTAQQVPEDSDAENQNKNYVSPLTAEQIERYSRQLILEEEDGLGGVAGQVRMLQSSVLVVGAGGIGSTLLLYLAAAGIGRIGIVDYDTVEICNLHRQIIHDTTTVGINKAQSAKMALQRLNPSGTYIAIPHVLDFHNAISVLEPYHVIVDASDNPQTRYLLNDACVLLQKPLVSGSAVGTQGQCTVYYNNHNQNAPCYRCLYPKPQIQSTCRSCADAGVLGPVPGLIGILQAMETIQILTQTGTMHHHSMFMMYDAMAGTIHQIQKPKHKRSNCIVCGNHPTIRSMQESQQNLVHEYQTRGPAVVTTATTTGVTDNDKKEEDPQQQDDGDDDDDETKDWHVTCSQYNQVRNQREPHVLLDVRTAKQFELCALPGAINIPLEELPTAFDRVQELSNHGQYTIYCLCRRGIASLEATRILQRAAKNKHHTTATITATTQQPEKIDLVVRNIRGGLTAWRKDVDPSFPKY